MGARVEDIRTGHKRMKDLGLETYYKEIFEALVNHLGYIPNNLESEKVNEVIRAILQDFPDIFWFEGKWRFRTDKYGENYIEPFYCQDRVSLQRNMVRIEEELSLLDDLFKDKCQYEICLETYRWILKNVKYGFSKNVNGQNIFDAIVRKQAVCKGISKTYQFILRRYGIFSDIVLGTIDGINRHVWNVVCLENRFFNIDICMDYTEFLIWFPMCEKRRYKGFLLSDSQIGKTHAWEKNYPYRIKCTHEVNEYV